MLIDAPKMGLPGKIQRYLVGERLRLSGIVILLLPATSHSAASAATETWETAADAAFHPSE